MIIVATVSFGCPFATIYLSHLSIVAPEAIKLCQQTIQQLLRCINQDSTEHPLSLMLFLLVLCDVARQHFMAALVARGFQCAVFYFGRH
eukprot:1603463-Amphidinium_carterae.1